MHAQANRMESGFEVSDEEMKLFSSKASVSSLLSIIGILEKRLNALVVVSYFPESVSVTVF